MGNDMNEKKLIKNAFKFLSDIGFIYSYKNDENLVYYHCFSKKKNSITFYQDYRRECIALDIVKCSNRVLHVFATHSELGEIFEGYDEMMGRLEEIYSEALNGRLSLYEKHFKMILEVYVNFLKLNLYRFQ